MVEGRLDPPDPLAVTKRWSSSEDPALLSDVSAALVQIRGAKSQAKVSMKTEISRAKVYGPAATLASCGRRVRPACCGPDHR